MKLISEFCGRQSFQRIDCGSEAVLHSKAYNEIDSPTPVSCYYVSLRCSPAMIVGRRQHTE